MPTIYLSKENYDAIIKSGKDPNTFVNNAVAEKLKKESEREKKA